MREDDENVKRKNNRKNDDRWKNEKSQREQEKKRKKQQKMEERKNRAEERKKIDEQIDDENPVTNVQIETENDNMQKDSQEIEEERRKDREERERLKAEAKRKAEARRKSEIEAKRKSEELKRKEEEARQKEQEKIERLEAEAKRKAEEARQKEQGTKEKKESENKTEKVSRNIVDISQEQEVMLDELREIYYNMQNTKEPELKKILTRKMMFKIKEMNDSGIDISMKDFGNLLEGNAFIVTELEKPQNVPEKNYTDGEEIDAPQEKDDSIDDHDTDEKIHTDASKKSENIDKNDSDESVHTYDSEEEKDIDTYVPDENVHTYAPEEEKDIDTYVPDENVHTYAPEEEEDIDTYVPGEEVHNYAPGDEENLREENLRIEFSGETGKYSLLKNGVEISSISPESVMKYSDLRAFRKELKKQYSNSDIKYLNVKTIDPAVYILLNEYNPELATQYVKASNAESKKIMPCELHYDLRTILDKRVTSGSRIKDLILKFRVRDYSHINGDVNFGIATVEGDLFDFKLRDLFKRIFGKKSNKPLPPADKPKSNEYYEPHTDSGENTETKEDRSKENEIKIGDFISIVDGAEGYSDLDKLIPSLKYNKINDEDSIKGYVLSRIALRDKKGRIVQESATGVSIEDLKRDYPDAQVMVNIDWIKETEENGVKKLVMEKDMGWIKEECIRKTSIEINKSAESVIGDYNQNIKDEKRLERMRDYTENSESDEKSMVD